MRESGSRVWKVSKHFSFFWLKLIILSFGGTIAKVPAEVGAVSIHPTASIITCNRRKEGEVYLLVGIQKKAVPDGAQPRRGEHAAPLSAADGARAAEQRHDALQQHHRVVQSHEEAIGEEPGQDLKCDEQLRARRAHLLWRGSARVSAALRLREGGWLRSARTHGSICCAPAARSARGAGGASVRASSLRSPPD